MTRFDTTVVMITGAAGGIGKELARQFGAQGAAIAAIDRSESVLSLIADLKTEGIPAEAAIADIGNAETVETAVRALHRQLGPIGILINNAGYSSRTTMARTDIESWHNDINSNLNGTYHVTQAVLPAMISTNTGVIVNIASVNGLMALGDPAYSAAKAGMISYTKSLAVEYGQYGIRANVICPGTVRTPIWDKRVRKNPLVMEDLRKWYPLGRIVEPAEIAKATVFLASDDAAAITGAVLPVDCGLSAGNNLMARELTVDNS